MMNDLKFAFRQLLKNPGFTTVAVLTLLASRGTSFSHNAFAKDEKIAVSGGL